MTEADRVPYLMGDEGLELAADNRPDHDVRFGDRDKFGTSRARIVMRRISQADRARESAVAEAIVGFVGADVDDIFGVLRVCGVSGWRRIVAKVDVRTRIVCPCCRSSCNRRWSVDTSDCTCDVRAERKAATDLTSSHTHGKASGNTAT